MKKHVTINLLLILFVLTFFCSPQYSLCQQNNGETVSVQVISPEKKTLSRKTTQPGTLYSFYEAEIYAKSTGYVNEVFIDIGDNVKKGEPLASIDVPELYKAYERQQAELQRLESEYERHLSQVNVAETKVNASRAYLKETEAQIAKAKAQLHADESEFNRVQKLIEAKAETERFWEAAQSRFESSKAAVTAAEAAHVNSQANIDVAVSNLHAAKAEANSASATILVAQKELEQCEVMIQYAVLKAPFDGIVTQRSLDPGDLVQSAERSSQTGKQPFFVITQMDTLRLRVTIPERDAVWVNDGDSVAFTVNELPWLQMITTVARTSKSLDPVTRMMTVECDLPNPNHKLLPGMFGQAAISLQEHPDALVLPAGAIRFTETGESYVYVVNANNRIQNVLIQTGLDDGHSVEIVTGLSGSEKVVTGMLGRLLPDQEVRIQQN